MTELCNDNLVGEYWYEIVYDKWRVYRDVRPRWGRVVKGTGVVNGAHPL